MHIILLILFLFLLIYGPQYWVHSTMKRYEQERDDFPGNGGEFARHLLDLFELKHVKVNTTEEGDHYNPEIREVALSEDNFSKKSLTAVVVAAHEVGHALQHAEGYRPLELRTRLVVVADLAQKLGLLIIMIGPVLALVSRSPVIGLLSVLAMAAMFIGSVIVHLVTLPVEFNASFDRALPILEKGGYLEGRDLKRARKILKAAALTYVSASLMAILNLARWLVVLRR